MQDSEIWDRVEAFRSEHTMLQTGHLPLDLVTFVDLELGLDLIPYHGLSRFGADAAALVLFFLPWVDIQCSDTSMATQSGVQIIYGGGSPSQEITDLDGKEDQSGQESMGFAPLVGLALLAVIGAVVAAFAAIRSATAPRGNLPGILCAVALGLSALQMMAGFPVKKKLGEELSGQGRTEQRANDPFAGVGEGMAQACYEESTAPEVMAAREEWQQARKDGIRGRPTKKNRRLIERHRGFFE